MAIFLIIHEDAGGRLFLASPQASFGVYRAISVLFWRICRSDSLHRRGSGIWFVRFGQRRSISGSTICRNLAKTFSSDLPLED